MGDTSYTVTGIAGSARFVAIQDPDAVEAYYLASDADLPSILVLLRPVGPPEGLIPFVAALAKSIDPKIFPDVQLVKSSFRQKMQGAEKAAMSVSVLGFTALLLASLGIVGLVAYSVSHRTKEIGIRIALGANRTQVLSVVLRQLTFPILVGLLVGVGGAAAFYLFAAATLRHQQSGSDRVPGRHGSLRRDGCGGRAGAAPRPPRRSAAILAIRINSPFLHCLLAVAARLPCPAAFPSRARKQACESCAFL